MVLALNPDVDSRQFTNSKKRTHFGDNPNKTKSVSAWRAHAASMCRQSISAYPRQYRTNPLRLPPALRSSTRKNEPTLPAGSNETKRLRLASARGEHAPSEYFGLPPGKTERTHCGFRLLSATQLEKTNPLCRQSQQNKNVSAWRAHAASMCRRSISAYLRQYRTNPLRVAALRKSIRKNEPIARLNPKKINITPTLSEP